MLEAQHSGTARPRDGQTVSEYLQCRGVWKRMVQEIGRHGVCSCPQWAMYHVEFAPCSFSFCINLSTSAGRFAQYGRAVASPANACTSAAVGPIQPSGWLFLAPCSADISDLNWKMVTSIGPHDLSSCQPARATCTMRLPSALPKPSEVGLHLGDPGHEPSHLVFPTATLDQAVPQCDSTSSPLR